MSTRTYGDKPIQFQLEENGEYYCVGSEVRKCIFLNFPKQTNFLLLGRQLPAPVQGLIVQEVPGHDPKDVDQ